jgi:hypothetical protein
MSYSLNSPCFNCEKEKDCTDLKKVQATVNEIHANCCDEGGHLGAGVITLMCTRGKAKS